MTELLHTGALIDVAVVVVGLELALLVALRRRMPAGLAPLDLVGQLLAGVLLMLAVRCAVTGADDRWTLGLLTASFPAHVFDLVRRARRRPDAGRPGA